MGSGSRRRPEAAECGSHQGCVLGGRLGLSFGLDFPFDLVFSAALLRAPLVVGRAFAGGDTSITMQVIRLLWSGGTDAVNVRSKASGESSRGIPSGCGVTGAFRPGPK